MSIWSKISPFMRMKVKFNKRCEKIEKQYLELKKSNKLLLKKCVQLKRSIKAIKSEKINLVFVCHGPSLWGSLQPLFDACINDSIFKVTIVAIPIKCSETEYANNGAEEFFAGFPCTVVNGYNYETGKWASLYDLEPDYIFFQTPYNVHRPEEYQSSVLLAYTSICYISYGLFLFSGAVETIVNPEDYINDTYMVFSDSEYHMRKMIELTSSENTLFYPVGYTRLDLFGEYINYNSDSKQWSSTKENSKFRIIWSPRWNERDGVSHFLDYKDLFLGFIDNNKDVDFIFRPHPLAFYSYVEDGYLTKLDLEHYTDEYAKRENANIDTSGVFLDSFFSSDLLIADPTSLMADYLFTGKPIIYCHKNNCFNEFGNKLAKAFYWAGSWSEVVDYVNMLRAGEDPLKQKRREILEEMFRIPEGGVGFNIKEIIKADFYK